MWVLIRIKLFSMQESDRPYLRKKFASGDKLYVCFSKRYKIKQSLASSWYELWPVPLKTILPMTFHCLIRCSNLGNCLNHSKFIPVTPPPQPPLLPWVVSGLSIVPLALIYPDHQPSPKIFRSPDRYLSAPAPKMVKVVADSIFLDYHIQTWCHSKEAVFAYTTASHCFGQDWKCLPYWQYCVQCSRKVWFLTFYHITTTNFNMVLGISCNKYIIGKWKSEITHLFTCFNQEAVP